jgi:peptidoglycan/LPS O-acetylase OafA/YrhL
MTSGFFLSYTLLKQYQKHRSYITVTMKIVRRFLRLWPIYLFCLFINWNILPLTGSGPLWPILLNFPSKSCNSYLPHIFMVSNLFQDKCFNHLWLLSLDCQLCLIFVPLLIIFIKSEQSKIYQYLFKLIQLILIISALLSGFYTSKN